MRLLFIALFVHLLALTTGLTLFGGQPYVGSPEQHAELDAITEAVKARRAAYAAAQKNKPSLTSTSIPDAFDKHSSVSSQTLENAHKVVDAAIQRWSSTYQAYVTNPRRNRYTSQQHTGVQNQTRRSPVGFGPRLSARDVDEAAVAAAAALLAEVEAAERARSGQLFRDYTSLKRPDPSFEEWRNGGPAGARKRAPADAGDPFWLEQLAPSEHGKAPFAKASNYKVSGPSSLGGEHPFAFMFLTRQIRCFAMSKTMAPKAMVRR